MANHEDYNDEDVDQKTEKNTIKILSDYNKTRPGKLFHEHLATMAAMINYR